MERGYYLIFVRKLFVLAHTGYNGMMVNYNLENKTYSKIQIKFDFQDYPGMIRNF